jgi:hypothetical protein
MRRQLVAGVRLEWLLRLAVAGAFVGHGAYGAILAKSSWFSYFAAVGIPESVVTAHGLMTIVGVAEMAAGVLSLVLRSPALLVVMAAWKIFTELLRPIAGEPAWEFIERASNMVAPLALLVTVRTFASPTHGAAPPNRRAGSRKPSS